MIKLVACDLDGTLLNDQHELPAENARAILKLQEAGIQFMSATGRDYRSVMGLFEPYGIVCEHLLLNGSLLKDEQGKTTYDVAMDLDIVKQVIDVIQHQDLGFNMYTDCGSVTPNIDKAVEQFVLHMKHHGVKREEAIAIMEQNSFCIYEREVKDLPAYLDEHPRIYKMETFGGSVALCRSIRKQLSTIQGLALSDSIAENVEITQVNAQKGITLQQYCEQKGIALSEVVVIGDSMNDLSMMEMFPHSIAVANANDRILKAAKHHTVRNTEFAIAKLIDEILQHVS